MPIARLVQPEFADPKQRQLFKNIVYLGGLSALLNIDFELLTGMVSAQYKGKDELIQPNIRAMEIGRRYARDYIDSPLPIQVRHSDAAGDRILIDGNEAAALGAIYGGATVCAWYPITPSTSMAEAFEKHSNTLRVDPETRKKNFAVIQAEDELAALGIVIGSSWNGARAFTCDQRTWRIADDRVPRPRILRRNSSSFCSTFNAPDRRLACRHARNSPIFWPQRTLPTAIRNTLCCFPRIHVSALTLLPMRLTMQTGCRRRSSS